VAAGKKDGPKNFAKEFRHGGYSGALAALEGTQRPHLPANFLLYWESF
jgi:hypothetical protein